MANATIIYKGGASCIGHYGGYIRKIRWVITDKYIERQIGVCCPSVDNLQLLRIRDVSYKDTCCCCSSCGVITIISSDSTDPEMEISGLPNSKAIFKAIRDAVDKVQKGAKLELNG